MRPVALTIVMALSATACGGGSESVEPGGTPAATDEVSDAPAETDQRAAADAPVRTSAPVETAAPAPTATTAPTAGGVLAVPADYPTITEAVDAARPGDLVLISPGVYKEEVNVETDELTIRGLEREGVVLDGDFKLDNGIRVLGARGVAVENLTVQNYTGNGVFFTGATGYRASYVTAYRNSDYGIYAFDSVGGQIEHSYGAGSEGAGIYVGQCYPCDALVDDVLAEHNGFGYLGTNSGGNLSIVNSTFRNNRVGMSPNSGSYELCYPERETTIVGNTVHGNNQPDTPAIGVARTLMGSGIIAPGGIANVIERNLVFDHDRTGIGLVPFREPRPNDNLPTREEWNVPCAEQRSAPIAEEVPDVILWDAQQNTVRDNVVLDSRIADLGQAGVEVPTAELGNCWEGNVFETSAPADLEILAPCNGDGAGDWHASPLDPSAWMADDAAQPPSVDYELAELPPLPELDDMPDAATAPVHPAIDVPFDIDLTAIGVPADPAR